MDPITQAQIKDYVMMFVLLIMVLWGFYLATIAIKRRQQNAMQKALLDKFASAQDFAEFMQSPAGQKYVMGFTEAVASPRNAILKSIQIGIVLIFLGAGFLSASNGSPSLHIVSYSLGNIAVCVGFGFLISAVVSYFLARKIDSRVKE